MRTATSLVLTGIAMCSLAVLAPASTSASKAAGPASTQDINIDLGRGPVTIRVPSTYTIANPAPLVILLHAYGSNSRRAEHIFKLDPLSEDYGFVYVVPDGALDRNGQRNWHGTDACCDIERIHRDDSGYLRTIIEVTEGLLNVDSRRIYVVGVSNGGFMSYRMACDHSDKIAAIVSLSGASFYRAEDCAPTQPVHMLEIHGTNDTVIYYDGGMLAATYPGALESVQQWASFSGCDRIATTSYRPLDIDLNIPGTETLITRYESSCQPGGSAELWTVVGGGHTPLTATTFGRHVIEYLYAHSKPRP
jgi:polyhydroxybutyrate depolymerase